MGWIIDSGASQHLCGDHDQFSTYNKISGEHGITIADGTKIEAIGSGEVQIGTVGGGITLTGVWHVPDIERNLLSVSRIVDAGYTVEFGPKACMITKGNMCSQIGERSGRLYHLTRGLATRDNTTRIEANLGLTTNRSHPTTIEVWHRRLGHKTLDGTAVQYISTRVRDMKVTDPEQPSPTICGTCALGRQHKETVRGQREKAGEILEVVHSDLCGPMQTIGLNGERSFISFIDETSGRVSLSLLCTKDEVLMAFQNYRGRAEKSSGKEVKALRTDGGGEYLNQQFKKYLELNGIQHIVSPPYSPTQNGRAERANRTIMESARCMLEDSKLDKKFWVQAILTAAHIHNHVPSRSHNDKAPLEYWTGKPPGLGHLRIFGSTTWVHVLKEKLQKLDPKSVKCVLMGYEEDAGSKVYRVYDAENNRLFCSRDVIIDVSSVASRSWEKDDSTIGWQHSVSTHTAQPQLEEQQDIENDFRPLDSITPKVGQLPPANDIRDSITVRRVLPPPISKPPRQASQGTRPVVPPLISHESRRSQRISKPTRAANIEGHYALLAGEVEVEPETLTEALSGSQRAEWRAAWESELHSLATNHTWVVEPLPNGRRAIGCRWLFRKKEDGRYKARLVAKGYSQ